MDADAQERLGGEIEVADLGEAQEELVLLGRSFTNTAVIVANK